MSEYNIFEVFIRLDILKEVSIANEDVFLCKFKEDIYSSGTVGKIVLFDKYGIKEYGPLTGDERLIIVYGKSSKIVKEFSLLRISKVSSVTQFQQTRTSVLELHFVDTYFKELVLKKFSRSWDRKKRASDIIEDVVTNMLDIKNKRVMNIESSATYFENFVMPYWTPLQVIRYLSDRAIGTKGRSNYGYLFFTNSRYQINYITLDNLLNNATIDRDEYIFETSSTNYDNRILSWEITGVDHLGIKELGGGQYLGFNPASKEFLGIEFDDEFIYSNAVKQITSIGRSALFDGDYIDNDSKHFNYQYKLSGETDKTIIKNLFYNNFIRKYSLHNMAKLLVTGHDKRFAGQKIIVKWPSASTSDIFSNMDSGQYLIKSIQHSFTPLTTPFYLQTLTCIKNAYESNRYNPIGGSLASILESFKFGLFK